MRHTACPNAVEGTSHMEAAMESAIRRGKASGLAFVLVVVAIAMAPPAASGAEQIVMLVPGIPGTSTLVGHAGWIDISSFTGSAVAPTASSGQPCQMTLQKTLDVASPHLWVATVTGQTFSDVKIDVVTVGTTASPFVLYEIQLESAEITSIGDSGSNAVPQENVVFKAANGILTFNQRNPTTGVLTPITVSFTC